MNRPDAGRPRPELRGRLRAVSALQAEVLLGTPVRRWTVTAATLAIVALSVAAATLAGLPFAIGMAIGLVAALLGGLWLGLASMPGPDRPLAGAMLLNGRRELAWFRRAGGRRFPPRTRWGIARWLSHAPDTPESRPARATYLLSLGRTAEAATVIDRLDGANPVDRFSAARLRAALDFETGGPGDLGAARLAFQAIDDPTERAVAAWQLGLEDARQRYVLGSDWRAPLVLAAGSADPRSRRVRAWLPTLIWGAAPLLLVIYVLALVVELVATGSIV
jgi:hypothetical protein